MVGEQRFLNLQQQYNTLKRDHDEALKMVAKYREDLKEAGENVKHWDESIYQLEKEKRLMQAKLDKSGMT